MCSADMVDKTLFRKEVFVARIFRVEFSNIWVLANVEGAANISLSHMCSTHVYLEVSWLGELLVTADNSTGDFLSFF